MTYTKFRANYRIADINIRVETGDKQLFDMAKEYFNLPKVKYENRPGKNITFNFEKKKMLPRGRWDLENWKKDAYLHESWSRDVTVRINYKKNLIKSYLSSQCKFAEEVIEELLIFRPLCFMLNRHGFFAAHAGCVVKHNTGVLVSAHSGRGKTIAVLNLVRAGFKFLSDEHIFLRESGRKIMAYALPQRPGIRKNLIRLYPELQFLNERKDSLRRKKHFRIDEAYFDSLAYACFPRLIIFPKFKNGGKLNLRPISKKEALAGLLKDRDRFAINRGLAMKEIAKKTFDIFASIVQQAEAYELFYSDTNINELAKKLTRYIDRPDQNK